MMFMHSYTFRRNRAQNDLVLDDSYFGERVRRIAANRESGASELAVEVVAALLEAIELHGPMLSVGRALLKAQPSMAPVWNAVRAALPADAVAFRRYAQQVARAPAVLTRNAAGLLLTEPDDTELTLVTLSFSGTVLLALQNLAQRCRLQVACADGRPALEGRRMAEQLAAAGIAVTHYTDAALGHAIAGADAVVVGADAVSPDWFLNKCGTRMLAAAATQQGVPVYVLATRDKFLSRPVASRLEVREEAAAEIWSTPPAGVTVRNPYFERTPLDLVSAVVSDVGVLGAALVPDACPSAGDELLIQLLDRPA